ncbi:MAG: DUF1573 domain-containing protein [Bacteroidaceae bacterium]|nr:DUF1573 domain-containing protein [Bacteroidaceae bacterium]
MKRLTFVVCLMLLGFATLFAKGEAEITFEKTSHNFGTFSEENPVVTCVFKFKNTGDVPLVIHQAVASCGCTVPEFTKEPIKPGESGELKVTYNGAGRFPGQFRKTVTVHSNAENDLVRLYIRGEMTEKDIDLQEALEKASEEAKKLEEGVKVEEKE